MKVLSIHGCGTDQCYLLNTFANRDFGELTGGAAVVLEVVVLAEQGVVAVAGLEVEHLAGGELLGADGAGEAAQVVHLVPRLPHVVLRQDAVAAPRALRAETPETGGESDTIPINSHIPSAKFHHLADRNAPKTIMLTLFRRPAIDRDRTYYNYTDGSAIKFTASDFTCAPHSLPCHAIAS